MSQTRIKVYGPPGTGKTTYCLDLLCDHLMAGDRVLFVSFTVAARQEAHDRLVRIFGEVPDKAKVSTIHALCLHALEIPTACIFECWGNKWKFYQEIAHDGLNNRRIKRCLSLYNRMRNDESYTRLGLDLIRQAEDEEEDGIVHVDANGYMIDKFETWKTENGFVDFTTLLERVANGEGALKDYDVVIIDEAQDLTVLQWRVMERVYKSAGTVYVVGDDDQSVYSFLGADVHSFLDWPCSAVRILDQTHRLPQTLLDYSMKLADRIEYRQKKDVHTKVSETGVIRHAYLGQCLAFNVHPTELYLVRNEYMLDRVQEILSLDGIPYKGRRSPWLRSDVQSIQTLFAWKDHELSSHDWKLLRKHLPKQLVEMIEVKHPRLLERNCDEVLKPVSAYLKSEAFTGPFWWEKFFPTIPKEIMPTIKNGIYLYGLSKCMNPTLELSTIHGAKGKEADRVYVCTSLTDRIKDSLDTSDDEHRLFYVAATRAKKELYIVTDLSANEETEYVFPPFN